MHVCHLAPISCPALLYVYANSTQPLHQHGTTPVLNCSADQLLALSALDIACCNLFDRTGLLDLARHPSNKWDSRDKHFVAGDLRCFMTWLHSRQVSVKRLYLTDINVRSMEWWPPSLELPAIEQIVLWEVTNQTKLPSIKAGVKMCPNASSMEQYASKHATKEIFPRDELLSLCSLLPRLTKLDLFHYRDRKFDRDSTSLWSQEEMFMNDGSRTGPTWTSSW